MLWDDAPRACPAASPTRPTAWHLADHLRAQAVSQPPRGHDAGAEEPGRRQRTPHNGRLHSGDNESCAARPRRPLWRRPAGSRSRDRAGGSAAAAFRVSLWVHDGLCIPGWLGGLPRSASLRLPGPANGRQLIHRPPGRAANEPPRTRAVGNEVPRKRRQSTGTLYPLTAI